MPAKNNRSSEGGEADQERDSENDSADPKKPSGVPNDEIVSFNNKSALDVSVQKK